MALRAPMVDRRYDPVPIEATGRDPVAVARAVDLT
jgi:hypothetical protein